MKYLNTITLTSLSIENLIPTCRLCNHYKRGNDLDSFRNWLLGGLIERIRKIYIIRVAEKYGMVTFHEWNKEFYFEKGGKYENKNLNQIYIRRFNL